MYELAPAADDGQKASLIGAPVQVKIRRVKLPVLGLSELSRALLLLLHASCLDWCTPITDFGGDISVCVFYATAISASNNILDVSRRIAVAC